MTELTQRIVSIVIGVILGYCISELSMLYLEQRRRKAREKQHIIDVLKRSEQWPLQ